MSLLVVFALFWTLLQIAGFVVLVWLSWRYFDRRYKTDDAPQSKLLSGNMEPTSEVFIDPKDGKKYRVYYDRRSGEREYVEEA